MSQFMNRKLYGMDYNTNNIVPIVTTPSGSINIIANTINLQDLLDVSISNVAEYHLLQYNDVNNTWVNTANLQGNIGFSSLNITGVYNMSLLNGTLSATNITAITDCVVGVTGNISVYTCNISDKITVTDATLGALSTINTLNLSNAVQISTISGDLYIKQLSADKSYNFVGNVSGTSANIMTIGSNLRINNNYKLFSGEGVNYITSATNGNLDIRGDTGNINISANADVLISSNVANSIKFMGPNNIVYGQFGLTGSNQYLAFDSALESGFRVNSVGNVEIRNPSTNWQTLSNNKIVVGTSVLTLGQQYSGIDLSNSVGYIANNLIGNFENINLANTTIGIGASLSTLGSSNVGVDLSGSYNLQTGNITGSLTNGKLVSTSIGVGTSTLTLGGTTNILDLSNSTGYTCSNITGTLTNGRLANTTINIAGTIATLGSANTPLSITGLSDYNGVSSSAANGAILRWNSSTSKWDRRLSEYACINIYGAVSSIATTVSYVISSTAAPPWNAGIAVVSNSLVNGLTWSSATGNISGMSADKYYLVQSSFNMGRAVLSNYSTNIWSLTLKYSNGTVITSSTINQTRFEFGPSMDLTYSVTGTTGVFMTLGITGANYSYDVARYNASFTFSVQEI